MTRTQYACLYSVLLILLTVAWRYQDLPMEKCAVCGTKGTLLNPLARHHILPQERYPELRDVATNLVVLCRRSHLEIGHLGDTKFYNPDVMRVVALCTNRVRNISTRE